MATRTSKPRDKKASWYFQSPEAMAQWGRALAPLLSAGDVLALVGPLGAGKTTLVQSIVSAMGYKGSISSPTFALANEYATSRGMVYHMDMYRLTPPELEQFPLEDYWDGAVSLIEWADKVRDRWPSGTLEIEFLIHGPREREIRLKHTSPSWQKRIARLPKVLPDRER